MFARKPSAARTEANRRNAQKSTGPKTAEGKRRSAQNACRHRLTAQVHIMTEPDRIAQENFVRAWFADAQPVGEQEIQLAQSLALDQWRMNHARAMEQNWFANALNSAYAAELPTIHPEIHAAAVDAKTFWDNLPKFSLLSLYEGRLNRNFHRNMKLFRELQKERRAEEKRAVAQDRILRSAGAAAAASHVGQVPNLPASASSQPLTESTVFSEFGFVCSVPEARQNPAPQPASAFQVGPQFYRLRPSS